MKMVRVKRDTLPPLTAQDRVELRVIAEKPDSDIDFSDIPPMTEAQWATAVRGRFYRPIKKPMTIRLDADVLAWLKGQGAGYQTRLNAILRDAMLHSFQGANLASKSPTRG